MDNRHALIVDCRVIQAVGTGERDAAKAMASDRPGAHQKILGADKNYETKGTVAVLRRIGVTPHMAQNTSRPGDTPSMDAPPVTRAKPSRSMPAAASRRCLARSNNGAVCASSSWRHREGGRSVWPACNRLRPYPAGKSAQACDGGGMNRRWSNGVAWQRSPESPQGLVSLKSADLSS